MRVLIACEFSGRVRDAFLVRGHNAVSCDISPTIRNGPHIQDDVLRHLGDGWDLMVAHPPCTYLCNSGVLHLDNSDRFDQMVKAVEFFNTLMEAPIRHIAVENPIPHGYAAIGKYDQIIQPWMFGQGETKRTCLWLKNLPKLEPTEIVSGRYPKIHRMARSANRGRLRSITYSGIASAMADQWGEYASNS